MQGAEHPSYVSLASSGELGRRAAEAAKMLSKCTICPQACGVNRTRGETGFCRIGLRARVASAGPHFGEEPPLVGYNGSGTIFFSGCNMSCVFCQNWDISQKPSGQEVSAEHLSRLMLRIQEMGCHNINLVSPSHVVPHILEALSLAAASGLRIPLVYNTGGYDSVETLELLDGVIDIYMPDLKYADKEAAARLSGARGYPSVARTAVLEMHRQVGDLVLDANGVATRGLLIRHLVLPGGVSGTEEIVSFIANRVSRHTYINIMDQYRPAHKAVNLPALAMRLSRAEYTRAIDSARKAGLHRFAR